MRLTEAEGKLAGLIVHEWIERVGGAEKVLDAFVDEFPDSDLFCLWNDAPGRYRQRVTESKLSRGPLRGRKALATPFMPRVWKNLQNDSYDWMLISSHLFAHQAHLPGLDPARKFVYAHTPARYLWEPELDARGDSMAVRAVAPVLRAIDAKSAHKHRNVAANSGFVRDRIERTWDVEAQVIHPPVDVERLQAISDWRDELTSADAAVIESLPDAYILGASRFVPYKSLDVVIAAGAAAGIPVVIAGGGPDEDRLQAVAADSGADVRFVIRPSDELLAALMQHATAYVFPPVEDFGIMPVEAMALGTPVVVNGAGGASESLAEGKSGVTLSDFSGRSLSEAVSTAAGLDSEACRAQAQAFSEDRFQREIRAWMSL